MTAMTFEFRDAPPAVAEFAALRTLVGWNNPTADLLAASMENSYYWVSVFHERQLVGTGRVIGDGAMYFYIQDVIVDPGFQGLGLGKANMLRINAFLASECQRGATIGLLSAKGKEGFYSGFGYSRRDGESLGLGMCRFV
ncbi:GNAT family N-acetyltransferase [Shewanella sedimentimangrovi]|uniref:GNAT family N-acetyltransferase n=1 Tax=Shewanella sedimentimangrovi TaxID=2814293 RepID=A0ABX7R7R0_9GAMM|nr:GNAT family N-acetyltransferase [Shewanella sedimentimangrovi]QSX38811.1 GNAT family N-acetyltransferase [Shewanella sedimentimangrovi]